MRIRFEDYNGAEGHFIANYLIGLFEELNKKVTAIFTEYENPRYSRTVVERKEMTWYR